MTSLRRLALTMTVFLVGCGSDGGTTPGDAAPADAGPGTPDGSPGDGPAAETGPVTQSFIILHTNDLHSHLQGIGPEADYTPATPGDDATTGGLARLAAHIGAARSTAGSTPVLLLDSGDFMMGTPFHLLGLTAAAELTEMGKLKYDAITLGNHEFDWGPQALAGILGAAAKNGFTVPIVTTNMNFSAMDPGDDALEAMSMGTANVLRRKLIKDVGGIKVGIFGLLGKDASDVSPLKKPITFADIAVSARAMVKELRQTDKVDVVIALSHSGTDAMGMGEDRSLAEDVMVKEAGGIDVIVSGHTHVSLPQPVLVGNTIIVQAGAYGAFLGNLQLTATRSSSGTTVTMTKYALEAIDDKVAGDAATQTAVEGYVAAVDKLLEPAGLAYKKPICETGADIFNISFAESGLGDLVADAYLSVTRALQPMKPPVIAIDAAGDIRDAIKKGKSGQQWFADIFRVQPLGIGTDMQPGTPLVTFYVNAGDIKSGLELSAAAKLLGKPDYYIQIAGMTVEVDDNAQVFQKVTAVKIGDMPLNFADKNTCYKLVTNLYVASLLGLVANATGGLLSVTPKQEDCATVITDLPSQIVDANPATPAVEQLKEWQALVTFASKFPDSDGNMIPNIPASYAMSSGRVVVKK